MASPLTVYSTSSDGSVRAYKSLTSWADIRIPVGGATLTVDDSADHFDIQSNEAQNSSMRRGFLFFDTSPLEGTIITGADLSVYGSGRADEVGDTDLCVVEGIQDDPLAQDDFGDHTSKTTEGSNSRFAFELSTVAYTTIALNATGIGWINKTGITKFCLRLASDLDNVAPGGNDNVPIWASEKGAGFYPRLVVTYTEPVVAPTVTTQAVDNIGLD